MDRPHSPIRLYRHPLSGHSHRVELFLSLLDLPYDVVDVDLRSGAHKSAEFRIKNPLGQVPVIEDGETVVTDSNAILVYLATKYDTDGGWLPRDPVGAAAVQRWLSLAAGQIASGPCAARLVTVFKAPLDHERAKTIANGLLTAIEPELGDKAFAAGESPTIADLAGYSYIAHAPEGGVSLEPFPNIRDWLRRIESLPRFVPMQVTKVGLLAA